MSMIALTSQLLACLATSGTIASTPTPFPKLSSCAENERTLAQPPVLLVLDPVVNYLTISVAFIIGCSVQA